MIDSLLLALICAGAFLLGSVPPGLLVAKIRGVDIRSVGSGNIGATNVLRSVGKAEAAATLVFDILKGFIPVAAVAPIFSSLGMQLPAVTAPGFEQADPLAVAQGFAGVCAILGHNFSIFLKFRGGKGVASSIGAVLALSPYVGLVVITLWLFTFSKSGISSLGALVAFAALPFAMHFMAGSPEKTVIACLITALIFIRHIDNIRRLIAGTEGKVAPGRNKKR